MKNNEKDMVFLTTVSHNQINFLPPEDRGNARTPHAPFHLLVWGCFGSLGSRR